MDYSDKMTPDRLFDIKKMYDIEKENANNASAAANGGKQDLSTLLSNPAAFNNHLMKLQEANRI